MKALNLIAAGMLVLAVVAASQRSIDPPDDPWFRSAVTNSPRPVLVKFGAEWCGPCRHMERVLDELQPQLSRRVTVLRIDIDEKPELARHYGVSSIPRMMLFAEGKVLATHGGFATAGEAREWVESRVR